MRGLNSMMGRRKRVVGEKKTGLDGGVHLYLYTYVCIHREYMFVLFQSIN